MATICDNSTSIFERIDTYERRHWGKASLCAAHLSLGLYLNVDSVAMFSRAQRGHAQRLWYQIHIEDVCPNLSHRQTDAVYSYKALRQDILCKVRGYL